MREKFLRVLSHAKELPDLLVSSAKSDPDLARTVLENFPFDGRYNSSTQVQLAERVGDKSLLKRTAARLVDSEPAFAYEVGCRFNDVPLAERALLKIRGKALPLDGVYALHQELKQLGMTGPADRLEEVHLQQVLGGIGNRLGTVGAKLQYLLLHKFSPLPAQ